MKFELLLLLGIFIIEVYLEEIKLFRLQLMATNYKLITWLPRLNSVIVILLLVY